MPELSALELACVAFFVATGAAVQSAVGFGLALIAAPPLLLIHTGFIPGPLMAASILLTALIAHRDRASIDIAGLGWSLAGRVAGTALAAVFLLFATQRLFDLAFGGLVITGVLLSLLGLHVAQNATNAVFAGVLSGVMGTISSIGGPPMALLYQHSDGARLRGTLSSFFVVGSSISIVALALVGRFGRDEAVMAAALVPPTLLGFAVAQPLRERLHDAPVRPAVLGLSLLSGAAVLVRAAWAG